MRLGIDVGGTNTDAVLMSGRTVVASAKRTTTSDVSGGIVAASAPKGGHVTYWDVEGRRYLGASDLADGCGLAPTHRPANFLLTSGEGWLVTAGPARAPSRLASQFQWDNHAILVR